MVVHFSLHYNAGEILSERREKRKTVKRQEKAEEKINNNFSALIQPYPHPAFDYIPVK